MNHSTFTSVCVDGCSVLYASGAKKVGCDWSLICSSGDWLMERFILNRNSHVFCKYVLLLTENNVIGNIIYLGLGFAVTDYCLSRKSREFKHGRTSVQYASSNSCPYLS